MLCAMSWLFLIFNCASAAHVIRNQSCSRDQIGNTLHHRKRVVLPGTCTVINYPSSLFYQRTLKRTMLIWYFHVNISWVNNSNDVIEWWSIEHVIENWWLHFYSIIVLHVSARHIHLSTSLFLLSWMN